MKTHKFVNDDIWESCESIKEGCLYISRHGYSLGIRNQVIIEINNVVWSRTRFKIKDQIKAVMDNGTS